MISKGISIAHDAPPLTMTRLKQKSEWEKSWDKFLGGGVAGCAAKTVVAPIDRVKILFQVRSPQYTRYTGSWRGAALAGRDILRQDGFTGLFRGHSATLLRIFPYSGVKWVAYDYIRDFLIPPNDSSYETPWRRFTAGALAGQAAVFVTYPLDLIRVRMAIETKHRGGTAVRWHTLRTIWNEPLPPIAGTSGQTLDLVQRSKVMQSVAPISNFYRGFVVSMCSMAGYGGSSFFAHDYAEDYLRSSKFGGYTIDPALIYGANGKPKLIWWAQFCAGLAAGAFSQTTTYPLEVIRRRMQVGATVGDGHRLRFLETVRLILREGGQRGMLGSVTLRNIKGFYIGMGLGYVKLPLMNGVSWMVYREWDTIKKWVGLH